MAVVRLNHVSVRARDLAASIAFYEHVFGARKIPTPNFGFPAVWMQLGDIQLHLFQRGEGYDNEAHVALEVDDYAEVYRKAKALGAFDTSRGHHLLALASGEVQFYLRDPAMNLLEIVWPNVATLPEEPARDVQRRLDKYPQTGDAAKASFYYRAG